MRKTKVTLVLDKFEREVNKSLDLIKSIINIREAHTSSLRFSNDKFYMIVELSFLKIFLAWEQFLESSFIQYMVGGKINKGYAPKKYVTPKDKEHALDLLKSGREYVDWGNPDIVIRNAKLFFKNGEPYKEVFQSMRTDLQDIRTIRNAIVHRSTDSYEKFETLVRRELRYAPRRITPGKFLTLQLPSKKLTYFEEYKNNLTTAGSLIVKKRY